mmetsp:Transcript_82735/g.221876  ORF Transcript_82735/g.221876 Transcript_82735/m.221876 type:complete len:123 (+) Transcript_82735:810-1178(+)
MKDGTGVTPGRKAKLRSEVSTRSSRPFVLNKAHLSIPPHNAKLVDGTDNWRKMLQQLGIVLPKGLVDNIAKLDTIAIPKLQLRNRSPEPLRESSNALQHLIHSQGHRRSVAQRFSSELAQES